MTLRLQTAILLLALASGPLVATWGRSVSGNRSDDIAPAQARVSLIQADESGPQKSYRWGVTRSAPLKVVQGWYTFDETAIREHGGGGRDIAEAQPMQLSLSISREDGFLVLNGAYGFSGVVGQQAAEASNRTEWPADAELRTCYLSDSVSLTSALQPLWKGELVQDGKVLKTIIYAVRVAAEESPNDLFDADNPTEALRIGRTWSPTTDPDAVVYEGRTISQWIAQWDARTYDRVSEATQMLTQIGRPAVPFLLDILKEGGSNAGNARTVLGDMGPEAEGALDWLIEAARTQEPDPALASQRLMAISCLGRMTWASDRLIPMLAEIAEDRQADMSLRQVALSGLSNFGGEAMAVIERIADSDEREIRDSARGMVSQLMSQDGRTTQAEYYRQLVEQDPFDPSVPWYLASTKGIVNSGRPHPLTEKVKALQRQRLEEKPDPELAWILAQIIQNELLNTELEWAAPTDSSSSRSDREDVRESFATLAEVLELGFANARPGSPLWEKLGVALAKLRLLQGDWDQMNAALLSLGQEAVPAASRPWLPAPPIDWAVGLTSHWQPCDESMRSGDCALEFTIEKDGKGLEGVHVLVKRAPEPTNVFYSGIPGDTLFLGPYPVSDDRYSFGYVGPDREQTRYAVTDASGLVRFEKLPDIPVKIEVLVSTSNFPEAGANWDLWMEVEPGIFKIARPYGGEDAVDMREPPAVVTLKSGQTVRYPRLVVREAFRLNVLDMDRAERDSFVLTWQGLDPTMQKQVDHYELAMALSAPSQNTRLLTSPDQQIASTHQIVHGTEWPVGAEGVGGMRLEPGNLYMFEVCAVDDASTVVARWPKTRVWVPWEYRRTHEPLSGLGPTEGPPIYHGVYFRSSVSFGDGREETLPQRVEKFLLEQPDAFEYDYVRLGKAWLDWHAGNRDGARTQLEQLTSELPAGNLARGTAAALLQQLDAGDDPPRRLDLVTDRKVSMP